MTLKSVLTVALAVLHILPAVQGVPSAPLERRGVCDSGIYGELSPILAGYPIAQAYCTQVYPLKCSAKARKRAASTTTTSIKTAIKVQSSAWSKCLAQPANVVSTLCSCIQKPCPTTTTTTTPTTTTPTAHTVSAPSCTLRAGESAGNYDSGGCSSGCSCDISISGPSYCANDFTVISCTSDAGCPDGYFCDTNNDGKCSGSNPNQGDGACTVSNLPAKRNVLDLLSGERGSPPSYERMMRRT